MDVNERVALVVTLSELSEPDFGKLLVSIPAATSHVTKDAPIPERTSELLRWAESSTGPGLQTIVDVYSQLFR